MDTKTWIAQVLVTHLKTYVQQICEDTGYQPKNIPDAMDNYEGQYNQHTKMIDESLPHQKSTIVC